MTNQDSFPAVKRMLAGYNLLLTGLIGMSALVAAFQGLFQKGSSHGFGRAAAAGVLVYGSAWAICGWRFGRLVLGNRSGGPPDHVVSRTSRRRRRRLPRSRGCRRSVVGLAPINR